MEIKITGLTKRDAEKVAYYLSMRASDLETAAMYWTIKPGEVDDAVDKKLRSDAAMLVSTAKQIAQQAKAFIEKPVE